MSKHFNDDMSMGGEAHYYGAGDPRNHVEYYNGLHHPILTGMKVRILQSAVGAFNGIVQGHTKFRVGEHAPWQYTYHVVPMKANGEVNKSILNNVGAISRYTFGENVIRILQDQTNLKQLK